MTTADDDLLDLGPAPVPAATKPGEGALPMPEGAGEPQENTKVSPHRIFVSFVVGKDKFNSMILNTPFEDIDSSEALGACMNVLGEMNAGKRVTVLFWRSLDG